MYCGLYGQGFQSTLPRRERLAWNPACLPPYIISIHAPAKGATGRSALFLRAYLISIHAPAKGATGSTPTKLIATYDFNPRSREGSDINGFSTVSGVGNFNPRSREGSDAICYKACGKLKISIHAPAKGATGARDFSVRDRENFNPRSREGSDEHARVNTCGDIHFNPRSREGSDFTPHTIARLIKTFQSTLPRRERRSFASSLSSTVEISIHAPAKGATTGILKLHASGIDFNPRSREGSDLSLNFVFIK